MQFILIEILDQYIGFPLPEFAYHIHFPILVVSHILDLLSNYSVFIIIIGIGWDTINSTKIKLIKCYPCALRLYLVLIVCHNCCIYTNNQDFIYCIIDFRCKTLYYISASLYNVIYVTLLSLLCVRFPEK